MDKKLNAVQTAALAIHSRFPAGKVLVKASKAIADKASLSLVYSPGVAAPCLAIAKDKQQVYSYTSKANSVAVVSNGTAVLGLGALGPEASKPVMEGKVALFSTLAYLNGIDLEIAETEPAALVRCLQQISPSFGAINLEDIKAPECFEIEEELQKSLSIPVLHDDQHGTATAVLAGLINALKVQNKEPATCKVVVSGAGAAALATVKLLCLWQFRKENIIICDSKGVINHLRRDLNKYKQDYAVVTNATKLREVIVGADLFIGLSVAKVLTKDCLLAMAARPIVFALANPEPEIMPELAHATRADLLLATGRSDYQNQINNVLCFPYIFRGALDVLSKKINHQMLLAAAHALAALVKSPSRVQIVPDVLDRRLLPEVAWAVAQAAIDSGVANQQISKEAFTQRLAALRPYYL